MSIIDDAARIVALGEQMKAFNEPCLCDVREMEWFEAEPEFGREAGYNCATHEVFHPAHKFDPHNEPT